MAVRVEDRDTVDGGAPLWRVSSSDVQARGNLHGIGRHWNVVMSDLYRMRTAFNLHALTALVRQLRRGTVPSMNYL